MNFSDISSILLAIGAFATAIYAIIGGRAKVKHDNILTAADVEEKLRSALYDGFEKQRVENEKCQEEVRRMRKEVSGMEDEIKELKTEVEIHKKEIGKLKALNGSSPQARKGKLK